MTERTIQDGKELIGGQIVMWDISPSSRYSAVHAACVWAGLEELMPAARTPESALVAAMQDVISPLEKRHKIVIRPVRESGGKSFSVFDENPDLKGEERFTLINNGRVEGSEGFEQIILDRRLEDGRQQVLEEKWEHLRKTMSTASVGTVMAKVIVAMGGIPLRDRGGVYWIPNKVVERWSTFAAMVIAANECSDKKSKVYGLSVMADDAMVECVGDQMVREFGTRLQEMQDAMFNDEGLVKCHKATVVARKQQVEEMRREASNFTSSFRRVLGELETQFGVVEALLGVYSIAESTANELEAEAEQNAMVA